MRNGMLRLGLLLSLLSSSPALADEELREIATREGVTVKALVTRVDAPAAVAILLPGGGGDFQFHAGPDGVAMINEARLPNRLRPLLRARRIASWLVDSPSDQPRLSDGFRRGPEHLADLRAVLSAVERQHPGVPVLVLGHSNGSQSAAYLAAAESKRLAATVLVAGRLAAHPMLGEGLSRFDWRALDGPLLLVHHKADGCPATPYRAAAQLSGAWANIELIAIGQDAVPDGHACGFEGAHNLAGDEAAVAEAVVTRVR